MSMIIRLQRQQKKSILHSGRILKDKGVVDLIKAIELLPGKIKSRITVNLFGKIDKENRILLKSLKKPFDP